MSEILGNSDRGSPLATSAVLLHVEQSNPEDRNLIRLLDFFAIPWKVVKAGDENLDEEGTYAILSSADCLAEAIGDINRAGETLPSLLAKANTVYVYGLQCNERSTRLLRFLTGDPRASVRSNCMTATVMTVTGDCPEMCGPMSGMRVPVPLQAAGRVCDVGPGVETFQSVIRSDEGDVFFGITYAGVRFYLDAGAGSLDIDALSSEYFDVRKFFCEAVPPVLYLKWAFRDSSWSRHETNACLIVDDPPLKRRYGFLDFREALDLMDRHNFTTTIAFIPWNWHRTNPATLSLFKSRPERLSLVVHGCDHTSGEFAERSPALLDGKVRISIKRMEGFQRRTSIEADRVMVFPQGQFSPETGRALKLNGFAAAVNTEVGPAQRAANETTIADLWSVAILKYGTFPILTRRYAHHGIENFAFDALLGKPCLIAAHHDAFKDHARDTVDFIQRLNSLNWNLVWRPLGEVIRRSFTTRRLDDGSRIIQMFAGCVTVTNQDAEGRPMVLRKKEDDQDCVDAVLVHKKPVEFSVKDGYLRSCVTILPGETACIQIVYRNNLTATPYQERLATRAKVAAKRYLSEFRDNYLARNDFLLKSGNRLKHFMK
jgi:hypothetical protein